MPENHPPQLNDDAQTFVDKIFRYQYASEKARVQMRKTFNFSLMSEAIRSKVPYDIATRRWKELCVYAGPNPPLPVIVGSPAWKEMWKAIDSILEMKPTCMADYFLKHIAGDYAVAMVRTYELKDNDPLKIPIINAAEKRMNACLEELEGPGTTDFEPEFIDKGMQRDLARLINCRMCSVDEHGCQFEFVIKDYGTSYVNGPWVKYRTVHDGNEGEEEIEILADQIDQLLKQAVVHDT